MGQTLESSTQPAHKTAAGLPLVSLRNGVSPNRAPNNKSKKSGGSKRNGSRNAWTGGAKRELLLAEDSQQYARVTKRFGDGRFEVLCLGDGQERLGHVRGKLWKRVWIAPQDIVLVALRSGLDQDQKADIVHKFTDDEVRRLGAEGELPPQALLPAQEDDGYEAGLQALRDVHGASRVGLNPTDESYFGFDPDA